MCTVGGKHIGALRQAVPNNVAVGSLRHEAEQTQAVTVFPIVLMLKEHIWSPRWTQTTQLKVPSISLSSICK